MRQAQIIQAAYDRLNVSPVTGLLSASYGVPAIFQEGMVPKTQSGDPLFFPYITINVPSDVNFSDKLSLGGNAIVQVDVWDRSGSKLILGEMMLAAINATVRKEWSGLPGFITCERESDDMIADADGLTMHGLIRLRVLYLDATIPPDPLGPWSSEFSAEFG